MVATPTRFIADAWRKYLRDVMPRDAGETQLVETRRAFYAGAWAVVAAQCSNGAMMTDLFTEFTAYLDELKQGRA